MSGKNSAIWKFINNDGDFVVKQPEYTSCLYFPLANEAGMMSSITPNFHGDNKISQHAFLLQPVSIDDLHTTKLNRNFWLDIEGYGLWSCAGTNLMRKYQKYDEVTMKAGLLWHQILRKNNKIGIECEITSFVPCSKEPVELMRIKVMNTSSKVITFTPTSSIPLYARSADNLRDHRHVTSLLHRVYKHAYGIQVTPTMTFDERGHSQNSISYFVVGSDGNSKKPVGVFPTLMDFIGEGGDLYLPKALLEKKSPRKCQEQWWHGKETIGALGFSSQKLKPGASCEFILMLGVQEKPSEQDVISKWFSLYNSSAKFDTALENNKTMWQKRTTRIAFHTGDSVYDNWSHWVMVQPIMRKLFGCSFLPDFDYGRGGRGWRDLWQDCLSLILINPSKVRELLINNCAGIRVDGSNATIIGMNKGEFIADRNHIPRVWMDHGFWPLRTMKLYMDQTGDFDILQQQVPYFCDMHFARGTKKLSFWNENYGTQLKTKTKKVYKGSILEHLLVQNLVAFFHVGVHNTIKLEAADWNDGLDMGRNKGESVAFTYAYALNLEDLANILETVLKQGLETIDVFESMQMLFDTCGKKSINYSSVSAKQQLLTDYFKKIENSFSGKKKSLSVNDIIKDLRKKAKWMKTFLRKNEWVKLSKGYECYNGYYDDLGRRVEGVFKKRIYMTLTGQVFAIMSGVATDDQVGKIVTSVNMFLKDTQSKGVRLNTDFGTSRLDLGRAFSFAYGEKENGAFFNHMCIMYGYSLYSRGFVHEGYKVIDSIYTMAKDSKAKIYPCIPEYFNNEKRGRYYYLTGSASWYILTALTQMFGILGDKGDLTLTPKLVKQQFSKKGNIFVDTYFAGKKICVHYNNPQLLDYGKYRITGVKINNKEIPYKQNEDASICIAKDIFTKYANKKQNQIIIELAK